MSNFELNRKKFVATFGLMMVVAVPMVLADGSGSIDSGGTFTAMLVAWVAVSLVLSYGLALEVNW